MEKAPTPIKISRGKQGKLVVQRGKMKSELTYQEVFSLGHSFFQAGHFHLARDVFSALAGVGGHGPRANVMLARCKAEIDGFEACSEALRTIFDGEDHPIAEELHAAFVFHTIGMRDDAIREMVKIVKEYPDFPTAVLYLGGLYHEKGDFRKAAYCWKLAVKRDRKGGAVAVTARNQLGRLAARVKKSKKKTSRRQTRSDRGND